MHLHRIVDWEGIISRHTEDMVDSQICEAIKGIGHDGGSHQARMANLAVIM